MDVLEAGGRQRAREQIRRRVRLLAAGQPRTDGIGESLEKTVGVPALERGANNLFI